ncbi:helix-turn-helix transcriptional regulator [Lysinibacillus sp. LZ02]|uniref:helix-turn-helix transcriptional regulator n=1 Tax=Lysinibacillus sp. LZ02 TaxID=3420668 RepID=UPI003D364EAC
MEQLLLGTTLDNQNIFIYRKPYQNVFRYWAEVKENNTLTSTAEMNSFSKVLRTLKMMQIKLENFKIIKGEHRFIQEFEIAQKGEKSHYTSQERVIDICQRLLAGEEISTKHDAIHYGVHSETIKSDIYTLRNILKSYDIESHGNYRIKHSNSLIITEAFVLLMMLYHNKSLILQEVQTIQEKIIQQFSGQERKNLSDFFKSFKYYYKPFIKIEQLEQIDLIFRAITHKKYIKFAYTNTLGNEKIRTVKPLTIILHDRMYYLICEEIESTSNNPKNFRLDRMQQLIVLHQSFKENQSKRFQPGNYIDESFNMFTGQKETIRLKIRPVIREYLLRKFPSATLISSNEEWETFEIIVLGTEGILFWILSQKADIEVISPQHFREKLKLTIQSMAQLYQIESVSDRSQ